MYWQYDAAGETIFFRWRVEQIANTYGTGPNTGAFASSDPWNSALWTVLIDTNGDGYRDFAVHLDGSSGKPDAAIDRIVGIYGSTRSQSIDYVNDPKIHLLGHNPTAFIDSDTNRILNFRSNLNPTPNWPNGSSETVWDYGTTRSTQLIKSSSCNEYYIDYQIPLALLDASSVGGPKVTANTPISLLFATANSLNNPLQKDVVLNGDYIADPTKPAPYGDTITLDGGTVEQPIVQSISASGCETISLTAQIYDTIDSTGGTNQTTVSAVDFYYSSDRNADGLPDADASWTFAASGTTSNNPLGRWTASWNTSSLLRGQYLIGVKATDRQGNVTWSHLTQAQVEASIGAPRNYANPSPTPGVLYGAFVNTCGTPPPFVSKTADPALVTAGATTQFTITVHNPTSTPITVNSVSDVLPAGFSYLTTDGGTLGSPSSAPSNGDRGTIEWLFSPAVSVPGGDTRTLIFTARAPLVLGTYSNIAQSNTSAGLLTSDPVQIGVGAPRLTISKAANVTTANPGDSIVYTITYANDSPVNVTNVSITDQLPNGLSFVSAANGGTYDAASRTLTWNIGNIASGDGPFTVSFTATVTDPYPSNAAIPLVNTATITSSETTLTSARASTHINAPRPKLLIQKDANAAQISAGGQVTFTISYANAGNAGATNVTISDPIPAGFTFVSATHGGTNTGGTVIWNIGPVAAGAGGTVQLTLQAASPYTAANPATNTATISSTETTPVSDSFKLGVTQTSQLCETYYFRNATTNVGTDGTQRIATTTPPTSPTAATVSFNATTTPAEAIRFYSDPATAVDVDFSGSLTTQFYIDKANGPQLKLDAYVYDYDPATGTRIALGTSSFTSTGSGTNQLYSFSVPTSGTLRKGHRLLWVFNAYSNQSTTFTFRFDGTASPSGANFCVTAPANLVMNKQVNALTVQPGGTLTYTIKFANTGQMHATGAQMVDTLPAGTTFAGATLNGVAISPSSSSGQQYTFDVHSSEVGAPAGQVTRGQSGTLVISVNVNQPLAPAVLSLVNTATLQSVQTSPISDSITAQVIRPDVSISKAVDKTLLIPGDVVTFKLTVSNSGIGTATNVTINDVLPATGYFSYVSGSTRLNDNPVTPDPVSGTTLNLDIGSLTTGASATVTFQMRVETSGVPDGVTTATNTASVSDAQTSGSRSSEPVTVAISTNPNLRVSKSTTPATGPLTADDLVTYTLTVTNVGAGDALNVLVQDPIPSNTRYVAGTLVDEGSARTDAPDNDNAEFDASNNRIVFHGGTLAGGSSRTFQFTTRINNPLAVGTTTIDNTVVVSASNASTKQDAASMSAVAAPDLSINKTAPSVLAFPLATLASTATSTTSITVNNASYISVNDVISINGTVASVIARNGSELTLSTPVSGNVGDQVVPTFEYILNYQNNGTANATAVVVQDQLASGLTFISADNGGTLTGTTVTWNMGTVEVGQSGTVRVRVRPSAAGTYANTATIGSSSGQVVASNTTDTVVGGVELTKATQSPVVLNSVTGTQATYAITLRNQLPTTVTGVTVTDFLSPGFTYDSTIGFGGNATRVTAQNPSTGDSASSWGTWSIPGQGTLTITFVADVAPSVGAATYQNEVSAASTNASMLPFDALETTAEDVRVIDPAQISLAAKKVDQLVVDADDNGIPSPGDTLGYTVIISNTGSESVTGIAFSDLPDRNTTLVPGSVISTHGSIGAGNQDGDSSVGVNIGALSSGSAATITFRVKINNPLPSGVTQVANQGTVSSTELPDVLTDDPDTAAGDDPTITVITAQPDLTVTIEANSPSVTPGSTLQYTLTYANIGNQNASGTVLRIVVPEHTVFNSDANTSGWNCVPNGDAGGACTFSLGTLPGNSDPATVRFALSINATVPVDVSHITSTVTISDNGANGPDPTPGNNTSSATTPFVPTAITLLSFTATHVDQGVEIRWTTGQEINTQGFHLYRSVDRSRANAKRITTSLIPAQGRGTGYTYVFMDTTAKSDQVYSYWLQEVQTGSGITEYGPVTTANTKRIWLPMMNR